MSKEQKDIRLQTEKCQIHEQIKQLRKLRKKILRETTNKIKDAKKKLAEDLVGSNRKCKKVIQECSKQ